MMAEMDEPSAGGAGGLFVLEILPPRPLHVADALTLSDFERSMLHVDACCFGLG